MRDLEREAATLVIDRDVDVVASSARLVPGVPVLVDLAGAAEKRFHVDIATAGEYALFAECDPRDFGMTFTDEAGLAHTPIADVSGVRLQPGSCPRRLGGVRIDRARGQAGWRAPDRAAEVCGQCHGLQVFRDEARWRREGSSFRPGQRLDDDRWLVRHATSVEEPWMEDWLVGEPTPKEAISNPPRKRDGSCGVWRTRMGRSSGWSTSPSPFPCVLSHPPATLSCPRF